MSDEVMGARLRRVPTDDLTCAELEAIRAVLWAAFPPGEEAFTEDDWQHSLGGLHVILDDDRGVIAHAAIVERRLHVGERPVRTGYIEAVATDPTRQGRGYGTRLMVDVDDYVRRRFEMGALGTGAHHFYERLGWRTWRGPTFVRAPDGLIRTDEDDGYILVLETPTSPVLDLTAPISCEWRPGDVW
jgi:aminoglycoside 2'-N-acetyltransferase I